MPTLFMMRHAQAEHGGADHERELSDKGISQAKRRGTQLHGFTSRIDVALVSDARRTRQTAELLGQEVELAQTQFLPELYDGSWKVIHGLLADLEAESAIVIGHEPVISMAAAKFASNDEASTEIRIGISTSTVVVLEVPSWGFAPGEARIQEILRG